MRIPATLDDVTAEWLATVLGAPVASIECDRIGTGVGILGQLGRVRITYDGDADGRPASTVVKLPTPSGEQRAIAMQFGFYEREVRFYEDVAPSAPLRVPRCWHAAMDIPDERFVLVLEDLSHLELADQVAGLSPARASLAVERLAVFHAAWWDSPRLENIDWMPYADGPVTMQAVQVFEQGWPGFVERWSHLAPPGSLEMGAAVRDRYGDLLRGLARPPHTIVHTDFRADNLLFGDPRGDDAVAVIDWQLSTRGGGAYDVAYLLAQSMDIEARRRHERDILRAWHDRLCAAGVTGYGFDQAVEDYVAGLVVCLVIAVASGIEIDLGNERGEALVGGIVSRGFSAALDADWESVLARLPSHS